MKEEKFKLNTFIGGWYINPKICDDVIKYYEKSYKKKPGEVGKGYIKNDIKKSTDVVLNAEDTLFDDYNIELQLCLENYTKKYPETKFSIGRYNSYSEPYNIQRYLPSEGFYNFHCERNFGYQKRCLVFMTYLNDVTDGGTIFKYQKITTPAKKGLTLIWPSDFTHTHKGQIANQTKYILTGWYNFIDKEK
jgi:prolyl 4-hydroxylase